MNKKCEATTPEEYKMLKKNNTIKSTNRGILYGQQIMTAIRGKNGKIIKGS